MQVGELGAKFLTKTNVIAVPAELEVAEGTEVHVQEPWGLTTEDDVVFFSDSPTGKMTGGRKWRKAATLPVDKIRRTHKVMTCKPVALKELLSLEGIACLTGADVKQLVSSPLSLAFASSAVQSMLKENLDDTELPAQYKVLTLGKVDDGPAATA